MNDKRIVFSDSELRDLDNVLTFSIIEYERTVQVYTDSFRLIPNDKKVKERLEKTEKELSRYKSIKDKIRKSL